MVLLVIRGIFMVNLLTLDILTGYTRPVVSLKKNVKCLIDSGADTPVWTQGAERLQHKLDAKKIEGKKFLLSGFGRGSEIVDVYEIHDLELKGYNENGEDDRIIFKNVAVACTSRPNMVADLILPNTAFSHMNLMIRNLDVESPVVEIGHKKEEYYVNPIYRTDDNRTESIHLRMIEKLLEESAGN